MGFTCGYIYFIIDSVHDFIKAEFDYTMSKEILAVLVFVMFSGLSYVRKI